LLDRINLDIEVLVLNCKDVSSESGGETSSTIAQ
jgi:hypothetical protein